MDLDMMTTLFSRGVAVTTSDSIALPFIPNGLYVGGAGNVAVQWPDGTQTTFIAVPVGTILPIRPAFVRATNTTATNIVAVI